MATTRHHLNPRGFAHLGRLAALAAAFVALAAPSTGHAASFGGGSYGWPVKPFDRQHPVRGFFGDPRVGETAHGESKSFHFGIDISAPDGTPVYATVTGRIVVESVRPETVSIRSAADPSVVFAYWHIVPAVRDRSWAVAYETVIGRIAKGWEHVHFADSRDGRYLNPLRPAALGPFADHTPPRVHGFSIERDGTAIGRTRLSGSFDLVAEVLDETPLAVPGRWAGRPIMPAIVRWRLTGPHYRTGWRTAVDFRLTIPDAGLFGDVYARWTRQNHPWRSGRYRVCLARNWRTTGMPNGHYVLEVLVADIRGNTTIRSTRLALFN